MTADRVRSIGLIYETEQDLVGSAGSTAGLDATHYHWREPREIDAVEASLTKLGFDVLRVGALEELIAKHQAGERVDLVWNLSIRTTTRNRTAVSSAVLEVLGIPYTGADAVSRGITLNKDYWKPIVRHQGVPTPDWVRFADTAVPRQPPWPDAILKPVCEGYSLGVHKLSAAADARGFHELVRDLQDRFQVAVLCERFVTGRECVVAVVGHGPGSVMTSMSELTTPDGAALGAEVVGTTEKRTGALRRVRVGPDDPAAEPMARAAAKLMDLFGPADYATFDFRVDPERGPFLIDINIDATLHPERALAQSFALAGVRYDDVIAAILRSAVDRAIMRPQEHGDLPAEHLLDAHEQVVRDRDA